MCFTGRIHSGTEPATRLTPNPNVLVELGYALKALGQQRIIMVMNTHFGNPEQLPFDLRLKRVLTYSTAPEATERAQERKKLQGFLEANLRAIFSSPRRSPTTEEGHDHRLFRLLLEELPSGGSIHFIKGRNMAGFSFPSSRLEQLDSFWHEWTDADHEFLDQELEAQRRKLFELVDKYMTAIVTNTFSANSPGFQTVPPEWEIEQPDRFQKVVEELHDLAGKVFEAHQDLVRLGKAKLGVSPIT